MGSSEASKWPRPDEDRIAALESVVMRLARILESRGQLTELQLDLIVKELRPDG